MIPKIIHYCWVGGKLNPLGEVCLASWEKFCPGWTIKEWNEDNIPMKVFPYLLQAYENKKYANVSNFVRLYAIYNEGGIYLDTDVELIKNLDPFLKESCFFAFHTPPTSPGTVNDAIMGAVKYHPFIKEMIEEYLLRFDGLEKAHLSSPLLITDLLRRKGLDVNELEDVETVRVGDIAIFPKRYFHPYRWNEQFTSECVKPDTYGIHRFAFNWGPKEKKITLSKIVKILKKIYRDIIRTFSWSREK